MAKKGGLINRLILGSEKSEGYARATLPSNRWGLFWDIFKGSFGKLIIINLLILLFFVPLILIIIARSGMISNYGVLCPYNQPFGIGYQGIISFYGQAESIISGVNVVSLLPLPIVAVIASLGLAGGAYVIRNMVWTEGIFVANDFFKGIKQNAKELLILSFLYSVFFYLMINTISFANYAIALNKIAGWLGVIIKVFSYIAIVFLTIMFLHSVSMAVTYKMTIKTLIKNSILFTIGLLPQNLFFIALCCLPLLFSLLGVLFILLVVLFMLLIGISYMLLIWTDYCQWSYDKYINDRVKGAKKNRGIYEKINKDDSEAVKKYKRQMNTIGQSIYATRPVKPITDEELQVAELPTSFNREDLVKLNESKQAIYDDTNKYIEEHKNDPQYLEAMKEREDYFNQQKENDDEKQKRIEKAKKELAKRKKRR